MSGTPALLVVVIAFSVIVVGVAALAPSPRVAPESARGIFYGLFVAALAAMALTAVLGSSSHPTEAWASAVIALNLALASLWIARAPWDAVEEDDPVDETRGDDPPPPPDPPAPPRPSPSGLGVDWSAFDEQRADWEPAVRA